MSLRHPVSSVQKRKVYQICIFEITEVVGFVVIGGKSLACCVCVCEHVCIWRQAYMCVHGAWVLVERNCLLWMCVCICVCMCVCHACQLARMDVSVHIFYVYIDRYTYTHMYMCTNVYMFVCMYVHTYRNVYFHMYVNTYTCIRVCICKYIYVHIMHVYIHTHTRMHTSMYCLTSISHQYTIFSCTNTCTHTHERQTHTQCKINV